MIATEIGAHHLPALGGHSDKSSQARKAARAAALEATRMSEHDAAGRPAASVVAVVKAALQQPPVLNETTMFGFVCESSVANKMLHVWFYNDDDEYHTYCDWS